MLDLLAGFLTPRKTIITCFYNNSKNYYHKASSRRKQFVYEFQRYSRLKLIQPSFKIVIFRVYVYQKMEMSRATLACCSLAFVFIKVNLQRTSRIHEISQIRCPIRGREIRLTILVTSVGPALLKFHQKALSIIQNIEVQ